MPTNVSVSTQRIVVVPESNAVKVLGGIQGPKGDPGPIGPGVTELDGLTDVDLTGLADGQGLIYDLATGLWEPADVALTAELAAYSLASHDHSGVYSLTSHNHSGVYSLTSHNHSSLYLPLSGGDITGLLDLASGSNVALRFKSASNATARPYMEFYYGTDSTRSGYMGFADSGRNIYIAASTDLNLEAGSFVNINDRLKVNYGGETIDIYADGTYARWQPTSNNTYFGNKPIQPYIVESYVDGSMATPAYSWRLDPNTGWYRVSNGLQEFAGNGGRALQIGQNDFYAPGAWVQTSTDTSNPLTVGGTGGQIRRVASSIRFKTDVEDIDPVIRRRVSRNLTPKWYRPQGTTDPEHHSYYGLIAEEVAQLDPRLVGWEPTPGCSCPLPEEDIGIDYVDQPDPHGAISDKPVKVPVPRKYQTRNDVPFWEHAQECIRPTSVGYSILSLFLIDEIKELRSSLAGEILARRRLEERLDELLP